MTTNDFIQQYRTFDVHQLALRGGNYPDVDLPFALDQIAGWQTARRKLPSWAACDGIVYPPHISMEQCSGEPAALYKKALAASLVGDGAVMADLTGGFGVDFSYMARACARAVYVERQEHLCRIAAHNFRLLGLPHSRVVCGDSVDYLRQMEPVSLIYLDPARRDANGGRTYALEDCTPNVLELRDLLLQKAPIVVVKLSPMLDWHKVVADLGCVSQIHVLSVRNECKEMLAVMTRESVAEIRCVAVNDGGCVEFTLADGGSADVCLASEADVTAGAWLYEPNASLMKFGCFALLSGRYGVKKIGLHSNLFVSAENVLFPGRRFRITAVSTMNKKELRRVLSGITKANIAVRNFPLTAQELRKQLKLKDGGDIYLFGTTHAGRHVVLLTEKE